MFDQTSQRISRNHDGFVIPIAAEVVIVGIVAVVGVADVGGGVLKFWCLKELLKSLRTRRRDYISTSASFSSSPFLLYKTLIKFRKIEQRLGGGVVLGDKFFIIFFCLEIRWIRVA